MKTPLIFLLMLLCLSSVALATTSWTLNAPADLFETTSSSVTFNWTAVRTVYSTGNSYLWINDVENATNSTCANATACTLVVTGFQDGFFQWYITSTDNAANLSSDARWLEVRDSLNESHFRWGNDSGVDVMTLEKDTGDLNITGSFDAVGGVTVGGNLDVTGNITLGQKITFAFLEVIDNIVNGYIKITGRLNVTSDLNVAGDAKIDGELSVIGDMTLADLFIFRNLTKNAFVSDGVLGIDILGPSGTLLPHLVLQSGGSSQASYIMRSFMVVDELPGFQNTTNRTSCPAYMDYINETLKIDCNTTTTGADLLVSDDFQVVGEVWQKDTRGDWHFLTRTLDVLDELFDDSLMNRVNASIANDNFTVISNDEFTFIINIDQNETITTNMEDSIIFTNGTNSTPVENFLTYQMTGGVPTLTRSATEPTVEHAKVAQVLKGSDIVYASVVDNANTYEFISHVYRRFFDSNPLYVSGFTPDVGAVDINISTGTIDLGLNRRTTSNAVNSSVNLFYVLSNGTYVQETDVDSFTNYSDGGTIGLNKYFNVVWGITHYNNGNGVSNGRLIALIQSEPNTEYATLSTAEADIFNTVKIRPTQATLNLAFTPVARTIIKKVAGTDAMQLLSNGIYYFDERGAIAVSGGANPPSPSIVDHNLLQNLAWSVAGHTMDDNVTPTINNTYSLGSETLIWKELFVDELFGGSPINLEAALDGTGFTITGGTFTDGVISITAGDLTGADDINATQFYQNGNLVLDVGDTLNVNSSNSTSYWDDLDDPTDITALGTIGSATSITSSAFVGPLTGTASVATTWDGETSQADLNVNDSTMLEGTDLGTLTDTKFCTYDLTGTEIDCNSEGGVATGDNVTFSSLIISWLSDTMTFWLDGTDTNMNWTDGTLVLASEEANTVVQIGKNNAGGSGTGTLQIQDDSGAYLTKFTQDDGTLFVRPTSSAAHVKFEMRGGDFKINVTSDDELFWVDGALGYIGMSTATPTYLLDVAGNMSATTLFRNGVAVLDENDVDAAGTCTGEVCGGGHTHPASEVTAGTFGAGNYVIADNLTVEAIRGEVDSTNHVLYDNSSCWIMQAGATKFTVCES